MNEPYVYNPKDTSVTFDGIYVTGLAEDAIEFEFEEERGEAVVGCQGDVVFNESNNHLATFTISVMANSPQYKTMLDYARKGTMFPIWGINKSIGERFGGTKARFKNPAAIAYGTELEAREFEVLVFDGVVEPC